jgi:hypothetical protein
LLPVGLHVRSQSSELISGVETSAGDEHLPPSTNAHLAAGLPVVLLPPKEQSPAVVFCAVFQTAGLGGIRRAGCCVDGHRSAFQPPGGTAPMCSPSGPARCSRALMRAAYPRPSPTAPSAYRLRTVCVVQLAGPFSGCLECSASIWNANRRMFSTSAPAQTH